MMLSDYHVHTHTSFDASPDATVSAQCAAALRNGVRELAITNHYELDMVENGTLAPTDLVTEEAELTKARDAFGTQLTLLRGIELGQPCSYPDKADALIGARDYDIVLGSVHNLRDGTDFYYIDSRSMTDAELRSLWEEYLQTLLQTVTQAKTDVLTHVCYPLRYLPSDRRERITGGIERMREHFTPIFRALIERGLALEINTSCLRAKDPLSEPDPGLSLLRLYRALGGKYLTVGSDAHRTNDVGAGLPDAVRLAKQAGFDSLTAFRKREKHLRKIDEVLL